MTVRATNIPTATDATPVLPLEKKWGWYALAAFGVFALTEGWLEQLWDSFLLPFIFWYVDGLEIIQRPVMSLSILDLLGLILRIIIIIILYAVLSIFYKASKETRDDAKEFD